MTALARAPYPTCPMHDDVMSIMRCRTCGRRVAEHFERIARLLRKEAR